MKQVKRNKLRYTAKACTKITQIDEPLLTSNRINTEEDLSSYNLLQLIVSFELFAFNTKLTLKLIIVHAMDNFTFWT